MKNWTKKSRWMNNGIIDTRVSLEEVNQYKSLGWSLGRLFSPNKGKHKVTSNLFWIHKNNKNKRIPQDQIDEYIANGWSCGMFIKN